MAYVRKGRLSWRRVGEQTVIVDMAAKRLYGLNVAGGAIWHALDGETGTADLAARHKDVRADDVARFLAELCANGLVDGAESESALAPPPSFAPEAPAVVWNEQIETFARACAAIPGTTPICNINPRS